MYSNNCDAKNEQNISKMTDPNYNQKTFSLQKLTGLFIAERLLRNSFVLKEMRNSVFGKQSLNISKVSYTFLKINIVLN